MELILVRHALPIRVEGAAGAADPPLSADGLRQAELCGTYLASEDIDAVYTSPMLRAQQTAAPLCTQLGTEAIVLDGVAEFDQHAGEYVPVEELKAAGDPRWTEMLAGNMGVDLADFQIRVETALDDVVSRHRGQRVVVVCHGGVVNVYMARVLGIEYKAPGFFYPDYTSIHRAVVSSSGVRTIVSLNETALRGSGLTSSINR